MKTIKSRRGRTSNLFRLSLMAALVLVAAPSIAADTVKIYRSTMPDGSVVLGDKPSAGARSVTSNSYVLTAPRGAAEAEREYWRRQSEAFNLRLQREDEAPRRRMSLRPADGLHGGPVDEDYWVPVVAYGNPGRPLVPAHRVPRHYISSPGAVRGRSGSFIGSGFSTAQ